MPIDLQELVRDLHPDSTILLFGAGSSLPSHGPSVSDIMDHLSKKFGESSEGFTLSEFTQLLEQKSKDRRRLVTELRFMFRGLKPTAGLLNLPLYSWKSIYTANYDDLIEQVYKKKSIPLASISSSFDFGVGSRTNSARLFKLHGTIEKDVSFGDSSRLIITDNDYNLANEYREALFDTLKADLADSNLVIIGHSLSDEDIKSIITRAIQINSQAMSSGRIVLLMYKKDENRAILYEGRGLRVAFGGVDEFFLEMAKKSPGPLFDYQPSDMILEQYPVLVPTVTDVTHQIENAKPDVSRMFNGWPANYADIGQKLTFERSISTTIADYVLSATGICAALLGASGVGKTTAIRQIVLQLKKAGYLCWEHNDDYSLQSSEWMNVARTLRKVGRRGVLFIDDANGHLRDINELIDGLVSEKNTSLVILLSCTRNTWRPRVKSPNLFKCGRTFNLSRLDNGEIDRLLYLVDSTSELSKIVESSFSGFNKMERRRRLIERCEADMFVCMKNIFASESFDNIILREFNELPSNLQDIYRLVSALETSGVRVHRQLIIRLLSIPMFTTLSLLDSLTDIVSEYNIDERRHVYGWRGRHPVISAIVTKYKFNEATRVVDLFELVIDNTLPTYDLEVRSLVDLCNIDTGIPRIPNKETQNHLLRKIVSVLPGHRVPRHRLIRNLTDLGHFDQAETEIRIFEKDFKKTDAPVARLRVELLVARAIETSKLAREDRLAILDQAREKALLGIRRHGQAKAVFAAYCSVGLHILQLSGNPDVFNDAMVKIKEAEKRLFDPDIANIIRRYEHMEAGYTIANAAEEELVPAVDID